MTLGAICTAIQLRVVSELRTFRESRKRTGALSFVQSSLCAQLANDLRGFPIAGRSFTHLRTRRAAVNPGFYMPRIPECPDGSFDSRRCTPTPLPQS